MGVRLLKLVQKFVELQMSPLTLSIFVRVLQKCCNIAVTPRTEELLKLVIHLREELQCLANAAELEEQLRENTVPQIRELKALCTIIFTIGSYFFPQTASLEKLNLRWFL